MATAYVTIQEAEDYFDTRLHEKAWSQASSSDRFPALVAATRIIDSLNFKGFKHTVWQAFEDDEELFDCFMAGDATALQTVREANASQELEFPRGADTETPEKIKWACYEIAHELLDGVDPDLELENMSMNDHGIGSVRASYNRNQEPLEHFMNGVPSATAWKYLRPYLRDHDQLRLYRVS